MLAPGLFRGRAIMGTHLGHLSLAGLTPTDLEGRLAAYNTVLQSQHLTITIRGHTKRYTFADLGIALDPTAIRAQHTLQVTPQLRINTPQLQATIARDFSSVITVPTSAALQLSARGYLERLPSKTGEGIELTALQQQLSHALQSNQPITIEPPIISRPPVLNENDITATTMFTSTLLRTGLTLTLEDKTWVLTPFTLRQALHFTVQPRAAQSDRYQLNAQLDETRLADYIANTLAPEINHPAQDARFVINDHGKVEQITTAQSGTTVNTVESIQRINHALANYESRVTLAVTRNEPNIQDQTDIEALDLTALLATGTTDFSGSPANRMHNIKVGTARYHGLLIPPGAVFSFNQFLGPVTAQTGYKPELVIKHNKTVPEYGGGLCQVSTTMFRAAAEAGLAITERRNHAYAVRYYGTPGFDATIYPPNTDFKFTNDTPGYLLLQTKIAGTKLSIEFWGKSDGRQVVIDGPHPYDRQPDGAVKATLKRIVRRGDTVLHDDTFYSRYRSPRLFPKPNENPLP